MTTNDGQPKSPRDRDATDGSDRDTTAARAEVGAHEVVNEARLDEDLSALVDRELEPDREAAVRRVLARDPALRDRADAFAKLDDALRALPRPPLPSDLHARTRARIAEAIRADAQTDRDARPIDAATSTPGRDRSANTTLLRGRRPALVRWATPLAALAAGIALLLWLGTSPPARRDEAPQPAIARAPEVGPRAGARPSAIARAREATVVERSEPLDEVDAELAQCSDEELAVAMEFELLNELDVIWQLEALEALAARASETPDAG